MSENRIRIVWIPNQLSKDGRIEKFFDYVNGRLLTDYLSEFGYEYPKKDIVYLSSQKGKVNPDDYIPVAGEEIIIMAELKDPISLALSIGWAVTASLTASMSIGTMIAVAYTVGGLIIAGALTLVGFAIYSAFAKPRRPSFGTTGGLGSGSIDESSPTYAWDGIRSVREVGIPVGIIYGTHRVGGNIINEYVWNDGEDEYLNLLIALGEGEIESISDIEINENPFENYRGLTKYERYGTNDQEVIGGFEELHNASDVGAILLKDTPYIYTSVDNDIEGFEVTIGFPYGIYKISQSSGSMGSNSATFRVEYKIHTDGDDDWVDHGLTTVSDDSRTNIKKRVKVTGLYPEQYDIRITKTSDDSTEYKISDMRFAQIDELKTDDLAYPNTALLGLKLLATNQLSGMTPNFTAIVKGLKIKTYKVMNGAAEVAYDDYYYDPASEKFNLFADDTELTWDGVSYVTAYSANPAWCMYDLITNNRYGIGDFISVDNVDLASFVEMAKYCDERLLKGSGGFEKRFEFSVVLDSSNSVLDILAQLCATFRAWIFYSQGTIRLKIDKPESPVQLFGMGNIIAGSFTQSWKSLKETPNVVEVQFLDANKGYENEIVAVTDESSLDDDPMRKKTVRVFTTSITRALREGRYALNLGKYVHRSLSFKASLDAISCQAGDVISVSHEHPSWGYSGRVVSGDPQGVTLDKAVTIEAGKVYKIQCRMDDDTIEEKVVTNVAGSFSTLSVDSEWTKQPTEDCVWSFGETAYSKKDFRIISTKRDNNNEVTFECAEYSQYVFDDSAPDTPESNYEDPDSDIPVVTDLLLTERVVIEVDGTLKNVIDVWWRNPDISGYTYRAFRYAKVYVSSNAGGSYALVTQTAGNRCTITENIILGQPYRVCVTSVTNSGREKPIATSPYADIVISGKETPPSNVTTFLVNQRRDAMTFGWTEVADNDLQGYEIRKGTSWESGVVIATNLQGNTYDSNIVDVGTGQSFWIKAIDTSGTYSETATEATVTVENVPFQNIVIEWAEEDDTELSFDDFLSEETFQDVDELRFSDNCWAGAKDGMVRDGTTLKFDTGVLTGKYTTLVRDVGYVAPFRIGITPIFVLSGDETWQSFGDATMDADPTRRFTGVETGVETSIRIRVSSDNITWSDWVTWYDADYDCRYFQLEFTFTRLSTDMAVVCSSLKYLADLPDVDDYGEAEVTVAGDGVTVLYEKTYHEAPAVAITILTGEGKAFAFTDPPDTLGFTVKLYKLDGTAVVGTFSYQAHGI